MAEVRLGPDGGYVTAFCGFCGLAFQELRVTGDKWDALGVAQDRAREHERTHPEWTEPKPLIESLAEIRASIEADEEAHHAEHGCTYGKCTCRCGCDGQTPCSLEPALCMLCFHYSYNRGHEEHGEPVPPPEPDPREATLTACRSLVSQWREEAKQILGTPYPDLDAISTARIYAQAEAMLEDADALSALLSTQGQG